MQEKLLRKYAELAVKMGVNVQPGQLLRIMAPYQAATLARYCKEVAYQVGARKVIVELHDELSTKVDWEMASEESLKEFPKYKEEEMHYFINEGFAILHIFGETPGLLKDIDPEKMQNVLVTRSQNAKPMRDYSMANKGQWSIISYPTLGWAKRIFPDLSDDEAIETLMEKILYTVRVDETNDPIADWKRHNAILAGHNQIMNDYNFDYLTFKNSLGTDLKLHLAKNHRWAGGDESTVGGVRFNPNMPTEESFCMPYKTKVDGKVVATKPLNYQGKLIDGFSLVFKDGKVVEYQAEKEEAVLKNLLEFDEGSCYLGEVALISHDSPISNTNILFYNTLFDENASCHLALGAAYPMNLQGFENLSEEDMFKLGYNKSMAHEDFMFGSACMEIKGYTHDGQEVEIFRNGNFVF